MTHFEISDDELSTEILHDEIVRLRAALDRARTEKRHAELAASLLSEQLSAAETAIDRLRAELAVALADAAWRKDTYARLTGAEFAIARVREMCAREDAESAESARIHGTLNMAVVRTRAVLSAIEGEQP